MDWIEAVFGVRPDAGSGTAELAVATLVVVLVAVRAHRSLLTASRRVPRLLSRLRVK